MDGLLPPSPILRSCFLALCFGWAITVCCAQDPPAPALRILVHDVRNQPVAGANCSLSTSNAKAATVTANSDDQGMATFANLSPGTYTLRVTKEGFDTLTKTDV